MIKKGIIPAMITPLNEDETIDISSLGNLIERMVAAGVSGIFVAGTMGEGPALRDSEYLKLIKESVGIVKNRVPVLANVSDCGTARCIDRVKSVMCTGISYVVATARLAFPERTKGETIRHIQGIANSSSVPVCYYENPTTTFITNGFEEVSQILSLHNVKAFKYSGSDRKLFARCVEQYEPEVPILTGNVCDVSYASSIGASGAISGIGSLSPALCVSIFEAARAGKTEKAEGLQKSIESIYAIYGDEKFKFWPSAQKHALKRLGVIKTNVSASPFLRLSPDDEAEIDKVLEKLDQSLLK